jgi:uncharacterized protein YnzC (UPF0291/DUF896 family)
MRTFLIDDEDALCRYLAAKSWTRDFVTEDDKKLQERLRKENAEAISKNFQAMLNEVHSNKCKTGGEDPIKKKKQLPDEFTKTVVTEIKVG